MRRVRGTGAEIVARHRKRHGPWFLVDSRPLEAHGGLREPRDKLELDKWCRLHQKLAPETTYEALGRVLCVFGADREKIKS